MTGFDQQVTFVYTADLEAATAFFGETLGLEEVLDQGQCRIFRVAGEAFVGVCHDPERAGKTEGVILTLVTDDVDAWARRLADLGLPIEVAPRYNERFDVYHLFVRGPDRLLVEIQQFRDPRWPRIGP